MRLADARLWMDAMRLWVPQQPAWGLLNASGARDARFAWRGKALWVQHKGVGVALSTTMWVVPRPRVYPRSLAAGHCAGNKLHLSWYHISLTSPIHCSMCQLTGVMACRRNVTDVSLLALASVAASVRSRPVSEPPTTQNAN